MTDPRLAVAVGLAAATLALFLAVIAVGGALRAGLPVRDARLSIHSGNLLGGRPSPARSREERVRT